MKHQYGGMSIDWLLGGEPRTVQLEALSRSYNGLIVKDTKDSDDDPRKLNHHGHPSPGWCHFMMMRLGKTATALNEFMLFKRDYGVNKMFVFSPNSFKDGWANEAGHFGIDVPVHVFDSKKRDAFDWFCRRNTEGLVIANYEALTSETNLALLEDWVDDKTYVAADESVRIKNPQSGFFKKSFTLSRDAAAVRCLTGLPNPQGVTDYWSQLRFARKISGTNFYAFRGRFAKMGGYKGKKITGQRNVAELDEMLTSMTFRANRRDWGTLIESDYEIVDTPMLPAQKKAYDEMDKEFITWLEETGDIVSTDQVVTKRVKMQQISSGFIYDEEKKVHWLVPFEKTPKWVELKDRLENQIPGKVMVVGVFKPTVSALYEALAPYTPALIAGNIEMKNRGLDVETEKNRFNEDPKCRVIVCQAEAVKYGHRLMGSEEDPCLTIAYHETSYNYDTRAQSEERTQGAGQQGAIHIFDNASSKIDKEIVRALQTKKDVALAITDYYGRSRNL